MANYTKEHAEYVGSNGLNEITDETSAFERLKDKNTGSVGDIMNLGQLDGKNIVLW